MEEEMMNGEYTFDFVFNFDEANYPTEDGFNFDFEDVVTGDYPTEDDYTHEFDELLNGGSGDYPTEEGFDFDFGDVVMGDYPTEDDYTYDFDFSGGMGDSPDNGGSPFPGNGGFSDGGMMGGMMGGGSLPFMDASVM